MAMKKCKECKKEISTKAKTCPHCGASTGPKEFSLGSLIVLCLFGWFIYSLLTPDDSTQIQNTSDWRTQYNRMMAYTMMEDFVKKELKSPSTAIFPGVSEGVGDHIKYIGSQTYQITSWVDAQNAVGGTLRTSFNGQIQQSQEYEWRLISLQIE